MPIGLTPQSLLVSKIAPHLDYYINFTNFHQILKTTEKTKTEIMASDEVPTNLKDVSSAPDGTAGARTGLDSSLARLSLASRAVHADEGIQSHRAVAPAMHVSTTFRYSDDPDALKAWDNTDVSVHLSSS